MELITFTFHPEHAAIHLVETEATSPPDDAPASLLVQQDGTLEPEGDYEDEGRFDPIRDAGLTVRDLVPADDRARELWTATFGHPTVCPRCGATSDAEHDPRCHTADGVPLFPDWDREAWLSRVWDQCDWVQVVAANAKQRW